jgi:hypothetical protein
MIENFPNPRRMNCETGMTVNMMQYYGYKMSEEMAFGIGGGYCFLYTPLIKTPEGYVFPILRTKPLAIVRNVFKRLHLAYHEDNFGNHQDQAAAALDALLAKNIPVGVQVNIGGLKYLRDLGEFRNYLATGSKEGTMNFNGHIICVIGEDGENYVIADTDFRLPNDNYVKLDKLTLNKMRFMPGAFTPHGKLLYLDPSNKGVLEPDILKQAIIAGMKESHHNMMNKILPYFGYRGLHYFANDLRTWHKKYNKEEINGRLLKYYRWIELGGTGGAAHRGMYADFLKESAVLFQDSSLDDCAALMSVAADGWRKFAVNCGRYMKQESVTLNEMADVMDEISEAERKTFQKIKKEFLRKQ